MNLIKLFVLFLLPLSQITWVTTVFAADASLQRGTEPSVSFEKEISAGDKKVICLGFQAGQLDTARSNGILIYGDVDTFYSQMHKIQCPPNFPSPIYAGVDFSPAVGGYPQMFRDLAKLTPEVRAQLLNRPTRGRRTETILDLIERRMKFAANSDNVVTLYQKMRAKFVELGAKKFSEMTPEELAVYE